MDTPSSSNKVKKEDRSSSGSGGQVPELTAGNKGPLPSSEVTFSPPAESTSLSSTRKSVGAAGPGDRTFTRGDSGSRTSGGDGGGGPASVTTSASSKRLRTRQQHHHHHNSNRDGNSSSKRLQFPDKLHRLLEDAERNGNQVRLIVCLCMLMLVCFHSYCQSVIGRVLFSATIQFSSSNYAVSLISFSPLSPLLSSFRVQTTTTTAYRFVDDTKGIQGA